MSRDLAHLLLTAIVVLLLSHELQATVTVATIYAAAEWHPQQRTATTPPAPPITPPSTWVDKPSTHQPSASCEAELIQLCDSKRKVGLMSCAMCAGANEKAIVAAGCQTNDTQLFCSNKTCAPMLNDKCTSCDGCKECVHQAGNGTCTETAMDIFCGQQCTESTSCGLKAENVCGAERRTGAFKCAECIGINNGGLNAANCTDTMLQNFCANSSCIPHLADRCSGYLGSCYSCATCVSAGYKAPGCNDADGLAFCQEMAPTPPPSLQPLCHGTLGQFCESARNESEFSCEICAGQNKDKLDASNCTDNLIKAWCIDGANAGQECLPTIVKACGHTLSGNTTGGDGSAGCGACAVCVAQANIGSGNICPVSTMKQYCESGCASAEFSWSADNKPTSCQTSPPPATTTWNCHAPPDGTCVQVNGTTGKFKDQKTCVADKSCAKPPSPP